MTRDRVNAKGENMVFADIAEVSRAYYSKQVDLQARIKVRLTETLIGAEGERTSETKIVEIKTNPKFNQIGRAHV